MRLRNGPLLRRRGWERSAGRAAAKISASRIDHAKNKQMGLLEKDKHKINNNDFIPYDFRLKELARKNRKQPTLAEIKMWKFLSRKQFDDLKFTRQKPLDKFIADFYCAGLKLAIEIDGESHGDKKQCDDIRDGILPKKYGIKTIRHTNENVLKNTENVWNDLMEHLQKWSQKSLNAPLRKKRILTLKPLPSSP